MMAVLIPKIQHFIQGYFGQICSDVPQVVRYLFGTH